MSVKTLVIAAAMFVALLPASGAFGGPAQWKGGSGTPLNLWSDPANWDDGRVPDSATQVDSTPGAGDGVNEARLSRNGTTTLIDSSVNAVAFAVMVGHPIVGSPIEQAASNTLEMTGGSLTMQGNYLMSVGRGRNLLDNQLAQFNVSGGVVNAAGIIVPEVFDPSGLPDPALSKPINAVMNVSGNAVVNTDLLRLGARDSNSRVTISDNARINLTDDNLGFAPGVLWIEAFEATPVGTSLLDIRDNALLTIHGEWWTDEADDGVRTTATATELQYLRDNYIARGWIVANGGADPVRSWFADGVIYMAAVPEPGCLALVGVACSIGFGVYRRRK